MSRRMNASTQRRFKEHFYHKLQCLLELRKWIVMAARDIPRLFTEWLKLEGASSDAQLKQFITTACSVGYRENCVRAR